MALMLRNNVEWFVENLEKISKRFNSFSIINYILFKFASSSPTILPVGCIAHALHLWHNKNAYLKDKDDFLEEAIPKLSKRDLGISQAKLSQI